MLIWPLAGSFAGIVGDLGQAPLADLAAHVTVESGRPRFSPVDGFTVAATTTIDPSVSHEMRYTSMELGQTSTLGWGQVWTVVLRGAALEGPALGGYRTPTGFVRGKPAVLFDTLIGTLTGIGDVGGNGMTLAWESAPGEETYISFSGRMNSFLIDAKSLEALRALADKGTVLTPTQWLSLDRSRFGW
jgi:hypothetical protein